ncbi:MAG: T9SS type A sorting domain-containing protein [Bacteroidetes bacterium]|nr:T9SS type A sorting domain-containing protein [Bacteroidota bacterium]
MNKNERRIESSLPLNFQVGPTVIAAKKAQKVHSLNTAALSEVIVGTSDYDLQGNVGMGRRIVNNGDGTISIAYTGSQEGMNSATSWTDRGSFYNYYDGTTWGAQPTTRIENLRVGWPSIQVSNGIEYVLAHTGATGMAVSTRTKGVGTWTTTDSIAFPLPAGGADVWPRLAVGGANGMTLHAIVNSQGTGTVAVLGQNGPVTYSRSQDGGATWDIVHSVLPGLDSSFYTGWGADVYSIDAQGDNVVIALADGFQDVVLMKSTDNGTTWTKTIVQASPLALYDPTAAGAISDVDGDLVADTVETSNGDVTVSIDANGIAHLAWSQMRYIDDDPTAAAGWSYFPNVDGIVYWNENMTSPVISGTAPDLNGDGFITIYSENLNCREIGYYGGGGLSVHPSLGFDASGNIYMAYATINELADTSAYEQSHRHMFAIKSTDGGNTWSQQLLLVPTAAQGGDAEYQEAVYGSIAKLVDSKIHVVYERDFAPDYSLLSTSSDLTLQCQAGNNTDRNDIVYVSADVNDFVVGVNEVTAADLSFSIFQNYPNPFSGSTQFEINLKKTSDATIEVNNVVGKLIKTINTGTLTAGINTITIDASDLAAGLYTYTVKVGAESLTKTMIVK